MSINTNFIKRIVYKHNTLVIFFDTPMMRKGIHSCLISSNYALMENENNKTIIPSNTVCEEILNGCIIRFTLFPQSYRLKNGVILTSGYINQKNITYISTETGKVNNFCTKYFLGNEAGAIDISLGSAVKINNSSIIYTYNEDNSFSPLVCPEDFYITFNEKTIYPLSVIYDFTFGNVLQLEFPADSLNYTGEMILNTVMSPKTNDIFGYGIYGDRHLIFQETDTIILQPGQVIPYSTKPINKNFIIYVSGDVPYRTYGYNDITTEIKGWVKIYEVQENQLNVEDDLDFNNVKIYNDVTFTLKNGDINLNNFYAENLSIYRI